MEKNWLPNGGDNNDNGDNIYAGMVATLVRSESLCALNGTPDSDSDFPGRNAEPWTWSLPSCLRGHPPHTSPTHGPTFDSVPLCSAMGSENYGRRFR